MINRTIDIEKLRTVTNRILDFVEHELGMKTVELSENFYWSVPDDDLYQMDTEPKELNCGSLIDDLEFVLAAHKDAAQSIPLVLMHIAPLLRALSTAVPNYKPPIK